MTIVGRAARLRDVSRNADQPHSQEPEIFTDRTAPTGTAAGPRTGAAPRCARRTEGKLIGGVAGGLADHLGIPVLWVRLAFIMLLLLDGFSIFVYAAMWVVLPQDTVLANVDQPAGMAAATRRGLRQQATKSRREDTGQLVAVSVIGLGVLFLIQAISGLDPWAFWPILVGGVGLVVLWRQLDEAQRVRWTSATPRGLRRLTAPGRPAALIRATIGIALVVGAGTWALVASGQRSDLAGALFAVLIGLLGLGLIVGPWVWRLTGDLSEERQERIRSQERADMAAHLHDSVLQTLALIQKQAHDQRTVVRLARAQERDLRQWLYGDQADADATMSGALRSGAAEVEDYHGVPVEVVFVGDAPMEDPGVAAVVSAAREAMVNAAKHSGAERIDVYAEAEDGRVEVFVRDRGIGFDQSAIPEDRLGVRRSILERMERHGGKAEVKSKPGEGTEVRLFVQRQSKENGT